MAWQASRATRHSTNGESLSLADKPPTAPRRDWFVGAMPCEGNPYDGHTLSRALKQVESITGTVARHMRIGINMNLPAISRGMEH